MAYLKIYGGIVIIFILLGGIVWSLYKEKEKISLIIVIVLIIAIPLWLNEIIYMGWYRVIPVESTLEPEDWMAFLGSYFSVAGTVIIGALAYWQTKVNRQQDLEIIKQNDIINELQNKMAIYQVKPVIYLKKGRVKVYTDKKNKYNNEEVYKNLYYMIHGTKCNASEGAFIHIVIPYIESNIVPIEKIDILELVWEIDMLIYEIELSKMEYTLLGNKIQILLDKNIKIKESQDGKKTGNMLIQQAARHQSYFSIGEAGYDNSRLWMKLSITNQMNKSREYDLEYQIYSEYEGRKLRLKNPHVKIVEGE